MQVLQHRWLNDLQSTEWPGERPPWNPQYADGFEMPPDGEHILNGIVENGAVRGWMNPEVHENLVRVSKLGNICLELGSWLGWSARTMLDSNPALHVICADMYRPLDDPTDEERPYHPLNQLDLFMHRNWDYRYRITILQGHTLTAISEVVRCEIEPDLIYVDSGHHWHICGPEIASCCFLWPRTHIFGDDYPIAGVSKAVGVAVSTFSRPGRRTGRFWELPPKE